MTRTLAFTCEVDCRRLDTFLSDRCPDLSRSRLQRLITEGYAILDGGRAKVSSRIQAGQSVVLTIPEPAGRHLVPQKMFLQVIYQDSDVLVVDKPAGLTVHPAPGQWSQTLANGVLALCPEIEGVGGNMRPGIVHRLDKNTSGLLVVAKTDKAHTELTAQLKNRRFTKVYLALVRGRLSPGEAIIKASIGRDPRNRKRMAVVPDGREAITQYRVLRYFAGYTLVEARPATGRTHQIRVHFASLRHPLVGDWTYGKSHSKLTRHFLHAQVLGFRLPSSGEYVEFTSELPMELHSFLEGLASVDCSPLLQQ